MGVGAVAGDADPVMAEPPSEAGGAQVMVAELLVWVWVRPVGAVGAVVAVVAVVVAAGPVPVALTAWTVRW